MSYGKKISKLLRNSSNHSALVGTALIGGIVMGATLAVLFAPKKGRELREDISDRGHQFKGTLSEMLEALKSKFNGSEISDEDGGTCQESAVHTKLKPKSGIGELISEAHKRGRKS
jgi:Gas vesicle protein